MQFLFGDRELILDTTDLFSTGVDVIVNAANSGLSHGGGIAGQMIELGGEVIQQESDLFIKEHGQLESGMVAFTSAGRLPYQAILHAVGPKMGEGFEQQKVAQAVSNCLKMCSMHDWQSVAFPAISTGIFNVPSEIVAQGFFRAITSFWDARMDGAPSKIIICLTERHFLPFFHAFRNESFEPEADNTARPLSSADDDDIETGIVNLSDEDISSLQGHDDVDDWFK